MPPHALILRAVRPSCTVQLQIQDIGLVFGAAYTILDVADSDGEQLIKLRNPPGDHEVGREGGDQRTNEELAG